MVPLLPEKINAFYYLKKDKTLSLTVSFYTISHFYTTTSPNFISTYVHILNYSSNCIMQYEIIYSLFHLQTSLTAQDLDISLGDE